MPQDPIPPRSATRLWPLLALCVGAVAVFWAVGDRLTLDTLRDSQATLVAYRDAAYLPTALVFVALYAAVVSLSLPGATITTLTGGFLFGIWPGVVLNMTGATLGATALFLAVRLGLGRGLAARLDASGGRMARIKRGLDRNQWSMLFFIRLVPVIPFFAANLLPALLDVPLRRFVISTFLGILPGALVYTSVGAGLGRVLQDGGEPDLGIIFEPHILLPILGLAALSLVPVLLRERTPE
nr:TVP38/TMEM64 family protein [Pseudooceanicola onchidii]